MTNCKVESSLPLIKFSNYREFDFLADIYDDSVECVLMDIDGEVSVLSYEPFFHPDVLTGNDVHREILRYYEFFIETQNMEDVYD